MWKRITFVLVATAPLLAYACKPEASDTDAAGGTDNASGGKSGAGEVAGGGKGGKPALAGGGNSPDAGAGGDSDSDSEAGAAGETGTSTGGTSGSSHGGASSTAGANHGGASGTAGANHGGTGGGGASGLGGSGGGGMSGSAGAAGGTTCGGVGQACCATGDACDTGSACLNSTACSCVKGLFDRYLLRNDGYLLYEADPSSTAQTAVLDSATGLPLGGITNASEGPYHGCAVIGAAKTAWCWRSAASGNSVGQLGNGTMEATGTLFRATQVLTAATMPLTNVVAVSDNTDYSGNGNTTCAVTADGKLYCWGDLSYLVNNGTTLNSPYAVQLTTDGVTPFSNVLQVSIASSNSACALVQGSTAKEVWCWGYNGYGELGTGDTVNKKYPTKILGLTAPSKVNVGGYYTSSCVIDAGNVRCWGYNGQGGVGDATNNTPILAPKIVTLMGGVTAISGVTDINGGGAYKSTCALTAGHTALCWGYEFENYPTAYASTNIAFLGRVDDSAVRFVTGDGMYHYAPITGTATVRAPNCGLLQ
ncbi:MAG: hypothetical protein WDO69_11160 [Pseudomonadota bacterium]